MNPASFFVFTPSGNCKKQIYIVNYVAVKYNSMEDKHMRKIKWGVLGTAGIARGCTIPGMQQAENCEMYAIAGRSMEKAEAFRAEFGFEKAYGSYEALLADPALEAVYIPLPNTLHYE